MRESGRIVRHNARGQPVRRRPAPASRPVDLAEIARGLLIQLDRRSDYLPQVLNEDPQWRMILNLLIARESNASLCVSDVCRCSATPSTTALRHLAFLERNGIVVRHPHPGDSRCSVLALHETAYSQVASFLLSVAVMSG